MPEQDASDIINSLNHEIRRGILALISSSGPTSYTQLLEHFTLSTGKLNYHLKLLKELVEKNENGLYLVSERGKIAMQILNVLNEEGTKETGEENAPELDDQAQKILDILQDKIERQQVSPYSPSTRKKLLALVVIGLVVLALAGIIVGYENSVDGGGSSSGDGGSPWIILVIIINIAVVTTLIVAVKMRKKRKV